MGSGCFTPPPSHSPLFSLASSPCSHSIPFPPRPSAVALALPCSPRWSRSLSELDQSHHGGTALLGEPGSCKCLCCGDHPALDGCCMSPAYPVPKHGAAGVTRGARTHVPQRPQAPHQCTQTLWRHRWVTPAGISHWCSCKGSGWGHGPGQQHPFEAAEIYVCPERYY